MKRALAEFARSGSLGCEDVVVILRVRVPDWELEEAGLVLQPGDEVSSWLTFREVEPSSLSAEPVQVVRGVALALPAWPGAEFGRHPVQINLDGGALYWDAPKPVEGDVEVAGTVSTNNIDAPDGFSETLSVVRRVRMEWQDFTHQGGGLWVNESGVARYEEVSAAHIPAGEVDAEVEAAAIRAARREFQRRVPLGRRLRGGSFTVAIQGPAVEVLVGATKTRWTGVLMDVGVTGLAEV